MGEAVAVADGVAVGVCEGMQVAVKLGKTVGVGSGVSVGVAAACALTAGVSVAWSGVAVGLLVAVLVALGRSVCVGATCPAQPRSDHVVASANSPTIPTDSLRLGTMLLCVALNLRGV